MQATGYMVEAFTTPTHLTIRPTNAMSRIALLGEDHEQGEAVIPLTDIRDVTLKPAGFASNGRLTITTTGRTYQCHYRRKQTPQWEALTARLEDTQGPMHG